VHGGDIRQFELFAPVYDLLVPSADAGLAAAIGAATVPVERLLDVGGGTGRGARSVDVPERIVIDPAAAMLGKAREHGLAAVRGDGSRLPVADGAVQAVLITDALHHVGDQLGLVREAYRVLAPGGIFVIQEFDPTTALGRLLAAGERLVGFDSRFHSPETVREVLAAVGFEAAVRETGVEYLVVGVRPDRVDGRPQHRPPGS